jgi:hypothetical protein
VYENERALSRAWVAERAVAAASPEAALWAVSGDPANRRIAVVEGPPDWIGFRFRATPAAARVLSDAGDMLAVEVPGAGPRVLVLMDTWMPGWKAFAGSRRLRVLPANCAFRAVAVPPGEPGVEFRYDPLMLKFGVRLFGMGLGVLLGVAGLAWGSAGDRSRRRR